MSLPIKLESIYDTILQRIQRQESHNRHLAISLLCWVLFAKRPLTSSELRHALAIDEGQTQLASQLVLDPSWFAKISGGLVQVDPNTSVVRFLHVSVRDYLTSRSTDWIANIETEVAKRCITYLNFDAFSAKSRLNRRLNSGFSHIHYSSMLHTSSTSTCNKRRRISSKIRWSIS